MKTVFWLASALMLTWAAYSSAPDLRRYLKIHSM